MLDASGISEVMSLVEHKLGAFIVDEPSAHKVVDGRTFVKEFETSRKLWFRLHAGELERVKKVQCDRSNFCVGPYGPSYDLDQGRVEILDFANPMINVITNAWDQSDRTDKPFGDQ